ncbi:MAG: transglutaminase family protein, partial [Candidatus Omnitrophica bacterium]|nr:transglutaminase family protein [Candidatus Omnitrophota bacterium]
VIKVSELVPHPIRENILGKKFSSYNLFSISPGGIDNSFLQNEEMESEFPLEPGRGPGAGSLLEPANKFFKLAEEYREKRQYDEAIKHYLFAVGGYYDGEKLIFGYRDIVSGEFGREYKEAARRNLIQAYLRIGDTYLEIFSRARTSGYLSSAYRSYQQALDIEPHNIPTHKGIFKLWLLYKHSYYEILPSMQTRLEELLTEESCYLEGSLEGTLALTEVYLELKMYEEARDKAIAVLKENLRNVQAHWVMIAAYMGLGEFERVKTEVNYLLCNAPLTEKRNVAKWLIKNSLGLKQRINDEALIKALLQLIRLYPQEEIFVKALVDLGWQQEVSFEDDQLRSPGTGPGTPGPLDAANGFLAMANNLLVQNNNVEAYLQALEYCKDAIWGTSLGNGKVVYGYRDIIESENYGPTYKEAARHNLKLAYMKLVEIYETLKHSREMNYPKNVIGSFKEVLRFNQGDLELLVMFTEFCLRENLTFESFEPIRGLTQSLEGTLKLGWIYLEFHMFEEARKEAYAVLSEEPENADAHYILMSYYVALKEFDRFIQEAVYLIENASLSVKLEVLTKLFNNFDTFKDAMLRNGQLKYALEKLLLAYSVAAEQLLVRPGRDIQERLKQLEIRTKAIKISAGLLVRLRLNSLDEANRLQNRGKLIQQRIVVYHKKLQAWVLRHPKAGFQERKEFVCELYCQALAGGIRAPPEFLVSLFRVSYPQDYILYTLLKQIESRLTEKLNYDDRRKLELMRRIARDVILDVRLESGNQEADELIAVTRAVIIWQKKMQLLSNNTPAASHRFFTPLKNPNIKEYLTATQLCDSGNPLIIQKATELTRGIEDQVIKSLIINDFVQNEIDFIRDGWDVLASEVLEKKEGWHTGKANLSVALHRAIGIPARFNIKRVKRERADITDYIAGKLSLSRLKSLVSYFDYTFVEVYLNGEWIEFDITKDEALLKGMKILDISLEANIVSEQVYASLDNWVNVTQKGSLHYPLIRKINQQIDKIRQMGSFLVIPLLVVSAIIWQALQVGEASNPALVAGFILPFAAAIQGEDLKPDAQKVIGDKYRFGNKKNRGDKEEYRGEILICSTTGREYKLDIALSRSNKDRYDYLLYKGEEIIAEARLGFDEQGKPFLAKLKV